MFFFLEANLELNYKMFSIHNFSLNREKLFSLLNRGNFIKRKIVEEHYKTIEIFTYIQIYKRKIEEICSKEY